MDMATKIAYGAKRYRVVTLNGETIEISGTMSGGGKSKMSGKMGQQVAVTPNISVKEMAKMEKGIEETAGEEKDLAAQQQELDHTIFRLKNEIKDLTRQQSKLSVEVNPLKEQANMLERQVADQKNRVKEAAPDKDKVA